MSCRLLGSQTRIGGLLGGSNGPEEGLLTLGELFNAFKSAFRKYPYISRLREAACLLEGDGYV